jgi:hypothetical protein
MGYGGVPPKPSIGYENYKEVLVDTNIPKILLKFSKLMLVDANYYLDTASQRAMMADELAMLPDGVRSDRQNLGALDRAPTSALTQDQAAKLFGVSGLVSGRKFPASDRQCSSRK